MKKVMIAAVLFAAIVLGGLFAQGLPAIPAFSGNPNIATTPNPTAVAGVASFQSPQSQATHGRLRSAADDFIRPDSYAGVAFDKWYGIASFESTLLGTLGFAAKIGGSSGEEGEEGEAKKNPFYLGAFYRGSFWAYATAPRYTERNEDWYGDAKRVRIYTTDNGDIALGSVPRNQAALILGFANIGLRLTFTSTHESFKEKKDFIIYDGNNNANYYRSYEKEQGTISPQLALALAKNLTGKGIKPWFTFDLAFNRNYFKTSEYSDAVTVAEDVNYSWNSIAPEFNIGLGGVTVVEKDGWRTFADLDYQLQITAYNNEYDYLNEGGTRSIGKIKGTNDTNEGLVERSFSGHRVRPSLNTAWNGEKLKVRGRLELPVILRSTKTNELDVYDYSLVKDGDAAKAFTFQFVPALSIAVQWQIIPALALNVGGLVNLNAISTTTTKGDNYTDGTVDSNSDYKTVAKTFGETLSKINIGLTINATKNFSIEVASGITYAAGANANAVNVFGTTESGLFYFAGVLLALKF